MSNSSGAGEEEEKPRRFGESSAPPPVARARSSSGVDRRSLGGFLVLVSGMEFIVALIVSESIYPGYSIHSNAISDLGATTAPSFATYAPGVFLWGLLWLLGAYFLFSGGSRRRLWLNLIPGAGILIVALFPENVNIVLHSIGSIVGILGGIVVVFDSSRSLSGRGRWLILILGGISTISAAVEFGGYGSPLVTGTLGPGGWERMIVYPLLLWQVFMGARALSRPEAASREVPLSAGSAG